MCIRDRFLRAQRMESIGTLAGGIAHDLNNVLSPILMAIDMLQLRVPDESSKKWFEVLRANAERGGSMVRQVLSFARGVEGERVALQPKHLVCLLYTSPSPRDRQKSRMPSSA